MANSLKPVHWIGAALKDLRSFPEDVRAEVGFALYQAQAGGKAINAVPLVGFKGSKVLEILVDQDSDTFRTVYTVKFKQAVYVLHAFQKKSKRSNETPQHDMQLIRSRLKNAEADYQKRYHRRERERGYGKRT